ncbi:MmgE/PrpD family protein [Rhodococcus sp. BP-252]|uniref:MmgE/PrpD family protein n=1 Tax=unclassified Rhodococcus (in: high G+C Gram-positive bacteria) TaxID=192944 RepID=UPI001C9B5CA1|nr:MULTISPECIES: MmgE/PrpD family protein [unclassified Rhodococcus (in: high G+C Gram-positive bacteria)]MBY6414625.1 MmgE/PrpD family protein [Rhodococcus sp. BP-320]MBY6419382.1 MmgE/PrpD family protein [Rhodococcus sp. BP-321]MBY6424428.1 MmgE/PrpD family protein [Rhodococcus sp. BP-324]MBY6429461.1 MmgE/PrpD family protein [Rhodococcus sp. BP-323]MBY6434437.1 MmgE/PrpD family protein [Rhodococcus sp. BP-322]
MTSRDLAEWAVGVGDLPDDVRHAAARHMLDGVGNAIAAARFGSGTAGWTIANALGGPGEARPLTGSAGLSAPAAAMATAVLIHALDFDDTHAGALVHPTVVSLPAAFAVGQETGATGAEILTAFALGLETACRLGAVSPHGFHARGMHASGVVGTLSSALVAGRLMGFESSVLVHALGIAGSSSAGLLEFLDSDADTKSLHPGSASFNGILAARLAAAGASGPASVLEGKRGLYAALSDRPADLSVLTNELGSTWETTRIGIKPYPSCQLMHVTLDAVNAAGASADEVADIEVFVHPDSKHIVCGSNAGVAAPRSTYDGKFDLPWSVAALLHDGAVTVETYTPESIAREEILQTARKVRVNDMMYDGPAASAPGRALITLDDGRILEGRVDGSRGSAAFPLDDDALRDKFDANCGSHSRAQELADRIFGLADEPDLTAVLDLAADISR